LGTNSFLSEAEREEILRVAFENIAKRDDEADELAARRLQNLGRVDHDAERARLEKLRASLPPRPEPKLDTATVPPDLDALISMKIAEALGDAHAVISELIKGCQRLEVRIEYLEVISAELERRAVDNDVAAKLADDARKLKVELATLHGCIEELRGVVAAEAKRTVFALPSHRYDLN
jgi:hypothetical protein